MTKREAKMTKREARRLRQLWDVLWRSNWTDNDHLKLLRRLMRKGANGRGN